MQNPQDSGEQFDYNLNTESYNVLVAMGPWRGGPTYHGDNKIASADQYLLGSTPSLRRLLSAPGGGAPVARQDSIYAGCGTSKICVGLPEGCEQDQTCRLVTAIQQRSQDLVTFEVQGVGEQYIAVGLSFDNKMGDDNVVACTEDTVQAFLTKVYSNGTRRALALSEPQLGIHNPVTSMNGDTIYCSFDRDAILTVQNPQDSGEQFDYNLNTESYNVLVAMGPWRGGPTYHGSNKIASADQYLLGSAPSLRRLRPSARSTRSVVEKGVRGGIALSDGLVTENFFNGCGQEKGCSGIPLGCEASEDCVLAVSYQGIASNQYKFEIQGVDHEYIAVGLSHDEFMGNDNVVACTRDQIGAYFTSPNRYALPLPDPDYEISNGAILQDGNLLFCSFERSAVMTIQNPEDESESFTYDLNGGDLHFVMATGPLTDTGELSYHDVRVGTPDEVVFTDFNEFVDPFYIGCGVTKDCFGLPEDCWLTSDCDIVVSVTGVSRDRYLFDLKGKVDDPSYPAYVAVGLSFDEFMGDDNVIACTADTVLPYFTEVDEDFNHFAHPLKNPILALDEFSSSFENGFIHCTFERDAAHVVANPVDEAEIFYYDLLEESYFLLLASGPAGPGNSLQYHSFGRGASSSAILMHNDLRDDFYTGCGDTKGCVGWPDGCVDTSSCNYIATYKGVSLDLYQFEVRGRIESQDDYLALGISRDRFMGQDSAMISSVINGQPAVEMYWNTAIFYRISTPLDDRSFGLSHSSVSITDDNVLTSRFNRKAVLDIAEGESDGHFDLNQESYFFLLASGDVNTTVTPPVIKKHTNAAPCETIQLLSDFNSYYDNSGFDFYEGCDDEKGCVGLPEGCIETKNCSLVASYRGISADRYLFEIQGFGRDYVAVGLSEDNLMGDDDVVACSEGYGARAFVTKVNVDDGTREALLLENEKLGIYNDEVTKQEERLFCSFEREADVNITDPTGSGETLFFSANTKPYHILIAMGSITESGLPQYHSDQRYASPDPVDLPDFSPVSDTFYEGCGDTKGCIGVTDVINEEDCLHTQNCAFVVRYRADSESTIMYQVRANRAYADQYLAVGLSEDNLMGDDSVVVCSVFEGEERVEMYYNLLEGGRRSVPLDDTSLGLGADYSVTMKDDFFSCEFSRDALTDVPVPGSAGDVATYDVQAEEYYFLFAGGRLDDASGVITQHVIRFAAAEKVYIAEFGEGGMKGQEVYLDCGQSKGCLGFPDDCIEQKNCQVVVTYQGVSAEEYQFEMQALDGQYAAVGFSPDRTIGQEGVVACTEDDVSLYWNTDEGHEGHNSVFIPDAGDAIGTSSTSANDGILFCTFTLTSRLQLTEPSGQVENYDLNEQSFTLLLAQGPTSEDGLILNHGPDRRFVSPAAVALSTYNSFIGGGYDGCGLTKGCFGIPSQCVSSSSCDVYTSYTMDDSGNVRFTVSGQATSEDSYVAVGLSDDATMGEDSTMVCYQSAPGVFQVSMTWNDPSKIGGSNPLSDPNLGLSDVEGSLSDGVLSCTFTRDRKTQVTVPGTSQSVEFDLEEEEYFLLLAMGLTKSTGPLALNQHAIRGASGEGTNLGSFSTPETASNIRVKVHAILMVLAWFFSGSCGIFIARYAKNQFWGKRLFGKDLWFILHQTLMVLTLTMSISSVTVMIVEYKFAPLNKVSLSINAHAAVGMTSICLAFIQPFMAMLRCHPGTKYRPVFNYAHFTVGISAFALALTAIYLATLESFTQVNLDSAAKTVAIAYFGVVAAWHLPLSMYSWFGSSPSEGADDEKKKRERSNSPDKIVLFGMVTFVMAALGLAVAMIVYIVKS